MSAHCHDHAHDREAIAPASPRYRRVLWIALWVNLAMFFVEIIGGARSGSSSLLADSLDFAGDAANYGVALWALGAAAVWRSRTAWLKGAVMLGFGAFIACKAVWQLLHGIPPEVVTMGVIGAMALVANVGVAAVLYAYREGDANMRAVWLCTRNDAIGNLAVLIAAAGVFGSGAAWPDAVVAMGMAALAMQSGWQVVRLARVELGA
jgi:cation diffusion facilitator family transporter